MSQMAPEAPPRRRDNAFTRKIGPLPMWAWLGILVTAVIIWGVWSARKNAQAQQQQSTSNSSDVPDFILQDYQQAGPPGPPGPPGTPGPAGPPGVTTGPVTRDGGPPPRRRPPARPPAQYHGTVHFEPPGGPATVRTSQAAPHPARKPQPRHTAPRHPARG